MKKKMPSKAKLVRDMRRLLNVVDVLLNVTDALRGACQDMAMAHLTIGAQKRAHQRAALEKLSRANKKLKVRRD